MEKIIEKISSYNLFNNLFPGAIYCFLINTLLGLNLYTDSLIENLFVYYFAGMVIGRIGSIVIEPFCKKIKLVVYASYKDFLAASERDKKLEILLEVNNTYRTVLALGFGILLTQLYYKMYHKLLWVRSNNSIIIGMGLVIIFAFSFCKQSKYINGRVDYNLKHAEKLDKQNN